VAFLDHCRIELTKQQKRELELLATVSDEDIALSDMREITDFTGFEQGPFCEILPRRRERLHGMHSIPSCRTPAEAKPIARATFNALRTLPFPTSSLGVPGHPRRVFPL
jgi:hypothetical protein